MKRPSSNSPISIKSFDNEIKEPMVLKLHSLDIHIQLKILLILQNILNNLGRE